MLCSYFSTLSLSLPSSLICLPVCAAAFPFYYYYYFLPHSASVKQKITTWPQKHTHSLSFQRKTCRTDSHTNLFDAVGVDSGLRLQDADRLCLLGALRHLPHLLSDEVMDTVQRLHCPLDQTHPLCRPCTHTDTFTDQCTNLDSLQTVIRSNAESSLYLCSWMQMKPTFIVHSKKTTTEI